MTFSYARGGWWLGLCATSLLACNLLLGNENGNVAEPGSSSGGPSAPLDAAPIGPADAATVDAATRGDAEAGVPTTCQAIAAPTGECFEGGACAVSDFPVTWSPSQSGDDVPAYPHALALWGGHLYYSAQATSVEGRNGYGDGQLFRVATALNQDPIAVSPLTHLSASAATVRDGFLFWRSWDKATDMSAIHRLELSRWPADMPCADAVCGYALVASRIRGRVNELWAASPDEVYARVGAGLRRYAKRDAAWLSVTLPAAISQTKGRLLQGFWTGWMPGASSSDNGQTTLYSLLDGGPQPRLRWTTFLAANSPLPFESSLIATNCNDTFLYEQWGAPPLRRVHLDAGLDAGDAQKFTRIGCEDCASLLTFAHVADARFSYLARPNANGGLLAVEQSGDKRELAFGDVWEVVVDDDAIYFTDVANHRIHRIAKHD